MLINGNSNYWGDNVFESAPNNKLIMLTSDYDSINNHILLLDFDNNTGKISNPKKIKLDTNSYRLASSAQFSADSKYLYFADRIADTIVQINQYDLSLSDETSIEQSKSFISQQYVKPHEFFDMQLGPDNIIYNSNMTYIKYPDKKGSACSFVSTPLYPEFDSSYTGYTGKFPDFLSYYNYSVLNLLVNDTIICIGNDITITPYEIGCDTVLSYHWDGPLRTSDLKNLIIKNASNIDTGMYYLTVKTASITIKDSIHVRLADKPVVSINPTKDVTVCYGAVVKLKGSVDKASSVYWSTSDTTTEITATQTGRYTFYAMNEYGCVDSSPINIKILDKLIPKITGNLFICEGKSTLLKSGIKYAMYLWSTGSRNDNITVNKPGQYWLQVVDSNGCVGRDTVNVDYYPNTVAKISGPTSVCENSESLYFLEPTTNTTKKWTVINGTLVSGDGTDSILVNWGSIGSAEIHVALTDTISGCSFFDTLKVTIENSLHPIMQLSKPVICDGESVTLSVPDGYTNYLWLTGETTPSIVVTKGGWYFVKVMAQNGCQGISDTIFLKVAPNPAPVITGRDTICRGDSSKLSTTIDYSAYLWSTGETTKEIEVNSEGKYTVSVIDSNGCSGAATFVFFVNKINISGLKDVYFGTIHAGAQTGMFELLKNESNVPVEVKKIYTKNRPDIFAVTKNPALPFILAVDSTIKININFIPEFIKPYTDSLIVEIGNPCPVSYSSYMKGTVFADVSVYIPDTTGTIGVDNFCMPLYIQKANDLKIKETLSYKAEIRYNYSALKPENVIGNIESNDRVINFESAGLQFDKDFLTLNTICGLVLLAETDKTPFRITNFEFTNPLINVKKQDGSLTINQVCQSPIRRIQCFTPLSLWIIPNPSNELSVISYQLSDDCNVKLTLVSCLGQEVAVLVNEQQKAGEYNYQLSVISYQLSAGLYFLKLSAGNNIITEKIIIMK